jgi:hypothetical protein
MLFYILLAMSVLFGIHAVWTSRLRTSARRHIVGPLARKLGWCMIATPLFVVVSAGAAVGVLTLMGHNENLAYSQGLMFGIAIVCLVFAFVVLRVHKYSVPIATGSSDVDWTNIDVKPAEPQFDFLLEDNDNSDNVDDNTAPQN